MKRRTAFQSISKKAKEIAGVAGERIGQAAIEVTHRALLGANSAVAAVDNAMHPPKRRAALAGKGKRLGTKKGSAKSAAKPSTKKPGTAVKKPARKSKRATQR